jgi:glycosyltransferase involved in cell wall biosynthesis
MARFMTIEKSRAKTSLNGSRHELPAVFGASNGTSGHSSARTLRVSVVIPARNEAQSLPYVLAKIPAWVHEVILVDGLSIDDTIGVAKLNFPQIRIVHQTGKGKGNALREGFYNATGDVIIALDADGSMDPAEIDRFVDLLEVGFDFVRGSRMLPGGSSEDLTRLRRFGNWAFRTITNALNGSRYTDFCYGYFAVRRSAVEILDLRSNGFEIETEINIRAHRAGLRTGEVPSSEYVRRHGISQLSTFKDGLRILLTIGRASLDRQARAKSESRAPHSRLNGRRPDLGARVPASLDGEQLDGHHPRDSQGA